MSELLGIEKSEFMMTVIAFPSLLSGSPENLSKNVQDTVSLTNVDKQFFIKKALKNPILFRLSPKLLKEKQDLYNYYMQIQGITSIPPVIVTYSKNILYYRILAYLINKKESAKLIDYRNVIKNL